MKTILFIHQSAELYGSDRTLQVLIKQLDKAIYKAVVVIPFDGPLKSILEKEGAEVIIAPVLKLHRSMFYPRNFFSFLKELSLSFKVVENLNKTYSFDIVYSNTLAVLLGMFYARKKRLVHIWHVHEIIERPKTIATIFTYLLKWFSNIIICNSYATKANIVVKAKELENKCVVVYNGISPVETRLMNFSSKESMGYNETDVLVTLVGRINRLKGHRLLLNAFEKRLKNTNIKLMFIGSPVFGQEHHLHEIEELIRYYDIQDKVSILPFSQNLQPIWDITDIAVMPSTEPESFGLVALEAMVQKKPVIGSNHGGLREIIINNNTGFLVEAGNADVLAEAIITLAEDKELRKKMGENGYERAVSQFSETKYAENIIKVMDQF